MDWIAPNNAPKDCIDLAGNGVFCIAFMADFTQMRAQLYMPMGSPDSLLILTDNDLGCLHKRAKGSLLPPCPLDA